MNRIHGFLLIVFLALSFTCNEKCNTDSKEVKIIGNWSYYYDNEYGELYIIDDQTFYSKSEIRNIGSAKYKMVDDSIWFGSNLFKILLNIRDHMILVSEEFSDTIRYDRISSIESIDNDLAFYIRKISYLMNKSIITPDSALRSFYDLYYDLYIDKNNELEKEELIPINR